MLHPLPWTLYDGRVVSLTSLADLRVRAAEIRVSGLNLPPSTSQNSQSHNCRVSRPPGPTAAAKKMLPWIYKYFSHAAQDGAPQHASPNVVVTQAPPLYLQYQGHSTTVIGIERRPPGTAAAAASVGTSRVGTPTSATSSVASKRLGTQRSLPEMLASSTRRREMVGMVGSGTPPIPRGASMSSFSPGRRQSAGSPIGRRMSLAALDGLPSGGRPPLSQIQAAARGALPTAAAVGGPASAAARGGVVDMTHEVVEMQAAVAGGGRGRGAGPGREVAPPQQSTPRTDRSAEGEEAFDFATMRGALLSSPGAASDAGGCHDMEVAVDDLSGDAVAEDVDLHGADIPEERPRGGAATRGGRGGGSYTVQPRGRDRTQREGDDNPQDGPPGGNRGGRGGRRGSRAGRRRPAGSGRGRGGAQGAAGGPQAESTGGVVGGEPVQLPPLAAAAAAAEARAASLARIGMRSPPRSSSGGGRGPQDGAQLRRSQPPAGGGVKAARGGASSSAGAASVGLGEGVSHTPGGQVHAWDPQAVWPPHAPDVLAAGHGPSAPPQPRHATGGLSPGRHSSPDGAEGYALAQDDGALKPGKVATLTQAQPEEDEWEYVLYVLDPQVWQPCLSAASRGSCIYAVAFCGTCV